MARRSELYELYGAWSICTRIFGPATKLSLINVTTMPNVFASHIWGVDGRPTCREDVSTKGILIEVEASGDRYIRSELWK